MARLAAALLAAGCCRGLADHACEQEVSTACPDSPSDEVAACLIDESMHEQRTELSSDCTDFIAVNNACKEDIEQFCEDGPFTDDTVLCLTKWTRNEDLSAKCRKVLKWAVPQSQVDEADSDVDELGRSAKDRRELKEWHAKRREGREEAIALMNQKETDARKEEERRAREKEMEQLKTDDPEEYQARREYERQTKEREAAQRLKAQKAKAAEEAKVREEKAKERAKKALKKQQDERPPYLQYGLMVCGAGFVIANVANLVGSKNGKSSKTKKKNKKQEKNDDSSDDKED